MHQFTFDEWIAERYELLWPELFTPEAIEPAVDFLARLDERWHDWHGAPFTSESRQHVSVWQKPR